MPSGTGFDGPSDMQRQDELFMLLTQTIAVIMNHSKSVRVEEPPLDEDRPQDHAIPRGTGPSRSAAPRIR